MPAISLFNRRWHLSSDDLPVPAALGSIFNIVLIVTSSIEISLLRNKSKETGNNNYEHQIAYTAILLLLVSINFFLHIWLGIESFKGTIWESFKRRRVPYILYGVLLLYTLTLGANIYGTWCLGGAHVTHLNGRSSRRLFQFLVAFAWSGLSLGLVTLFGTYNLYPDHHDPTSWKNRVRFCTYFAFCCCMRRQRSKVRPNLDFESKPTVVLANLLFSILGVVDMTLSDYVAGLVLLGFRHSDARITSAYAAIPGPDWLEQGQGVFGGKEGKDAEEKAVSSPLSPLHVTSDSRSPCEGRSRMEGLSAADHVMVVKATIDNVSFVDIDNCELGEEGRRGEISLSNECNDGNECNDDSLSLILNRTCQSSGRRGGSDDNVSHASKKNKSSQSRQRSHRPQDLTVGSKTLEEAFWICKYGIAAYGWKFWIWKHRHKVHHFSLLCLGRRCGCCRQLSHFFGSSQSKYSLYDMEQRLMEEGIHRRRILDPNFVSNIPFMKSAPRIPLPHHLLEREAICQLAGITNESDLIFRGLTTEVEGLIPYFIAVDHVRQSVIISIRGSMSMEDVITDLLCDPADFCLPLGAFTLDPDSSATSRIRIPNRKGKKSQRRSEDVSSTCERDPIGSRNLCDNDKEGCFNPTHCHDDDDRFLKFGHPLDEEGHHFRPVVSSSSVPSHPSHPSHFQLFPPHLPPFLVLLLFHSPIPTP
mmetsp:Transcript_24987/g.45194  ORF Transcript_24987/g.45194 Transcript_24987/m.45194 type:complete len:700 (-) Transcript_24987:323-2422(-)